MNVFIVTGQWGEYSDYSEWPVAAYTDYFKAKEHARLAEEFNLRNTQRNYNDNIRNPYDHDTIYMNDITYGVYEVPLLDEIPTPN